MIKLDYYRHSFKAAGELAERISQMGLDAAVEMGRRFAQRHSIYTHAVAGTEPRTWETLAAFLAGYGPFFDQPRAQPQNQVWLRILPAGMRFGNSEMFNALIQRGLATAAKEMGSNILGLQKILPPEEFSNMANWALEGVKEALTVACSLEPHITPKFHPGPSVIAFGHSPIIELAAVATGLNPASIKLAELEGIGFLEQDGQIICKGKID